jgi:bifunctional non-homologous end joining protein LigD
MGEVVSQVGHRFVVHEHHASRLHFDLRLEMDGVLKSWAVPKGPSMDPSDKRLAIMVEDHPLEYLTFHDEIADGNYGAGFVEIWDIGTYELKENNLEHGKLICSFAGKKLKGDFHMVRLRDSATEWLLMKSRDEFAVTGWKLEQIIRGGSRNDVIEKKANSSGTLDI